ncbi:hypothetical protein NQ315_011546 [Exocentrus adspersus]|uniref:Peptidase S1 domain-containing protein n=1 Tax=Exocentrus adspersus TaxID=1586481 RepID=A0AAV8VVP4_9CUCU|nr:hypothetical protein NQ315_011546 [Exocentrus adspersus]
MMKSIIFLGLLSIASGQQRSVPGLDGRIVGGSNATIADFPYQVSVQLMSSHTCGGAIISSTWVLTAGHCVEDVPIPSFLSVRVGSTYRGTGGQVYTIVKIISHPNYSSKTLDYDIALLQSSVAISTSNAQPVPLPSPGTGPAAGSTAIVTGWGKLSEEGPLSSILQVVQLPVISQQSCRSAYTTSAITDRMFCAGYLGVGGKDACQGDSGGPVVVNGVLVGLVSWGDGCAQPDFPGVFTNLPVLRAWITINSGV